MVFKQSHGMKLFFVVFSLSATGNLCAGDKSTQNEPVFVGTGQGSLSARDARCLSATAFGRELLPYCLSSSSEEEQGVYVFSLSARDARCLSTTAFGRELLPYCLSSISEEVQNVYVLIGNPDDNDAEDEQTRNPLCDRLNGVAIDVFSHLDS